MNIAQIQTLKNLTHSFLESLERIEEVGEAEVVDEFNNLTDHVGRYLLWKDMPAQLTEEDLNKTRHCIRIDVSGGYGTGKSSIAHLIGYVLGRRQIAVSVTEMSPADQVYQDPKLGEITRNLHAIRERVVVDVRTVQLGREASKAAETTLAAFKQDG